MAYNHVALMGSILKDPEYKTTPGGLEFCNFTLVVDNSYQGKDGTLVEKNMYMFVTLWGKLVTEAHDRLFAGLDVLVSGSLSFETWKDKTSGENKAACRIKANGITYFDPSNKVSNTEKVTKVFPGRLSQADLPQGRVAGGIDLPEELPF